jgi:glycosyltransferase involved in cell wall biosynthesis
MNIWIIREGEPISEFSSSGRTMRSGTFALNLAELGHDVTWWTSTYLHYEKRYIEPIVPSHTLSPNLQLQFLHSKRGYQKNISLKRFRYSRDLGNEFRRLSGQITKPDIIYCSWPLIDLAYEAVRYGKKHNVPVVIDIRDFWPDIFVQPFPKAFQPFAKLGIKLLFNRKVSFVMKHTDAVIGVIPKALEFAKKHGRELKPQDHVVHLSYDSTPADEDELSNALEFWSKLGLQENDYVVSYIGSIQNRIGDFDPVIETARKCTDPSIKFVLCGDGYYLEELKEITKDLDNIILAGYRNGIEIKALLQLSTFGLLSYRNTEDFIDSLPNKFGEYLSEGLIILTSLTGSSRTILEQEQCGFYYKNSEELLATILELKNNPDKLTIMRDNALKLFHNEFDASVVYSGFYKFLNELHS